MTAGRPGATELAKTSGATRTEGSDTARSLPSPPAPPPPPLRTLAPTPGSGKPGASISSTSRPPLPGQAAERGHQLLIVEMGKIGDRHDQESHSVLTAEVRSSPTLKMKLTTRPGTSRCARLSI